MPAPATAAPWSYSRIKAFDTCPKQFYHTHVLQQFPREETDAMRYGTEFHKACEEFIRDGVPVPEQFGFVRPVLEQLAARPGDKHCEIKMGLTERLEPCDFFAQDVWFRGVADLLIVDGPRATYVDYKTGKSARYADKGQLELMALAIFAHFPGVEVVRGGLVFTIANALVKETYPVEHKHKLWQKWLAAHARMASAFKTGVWNPRPSGLCARHCPVTECLHHGG